jgi:hypothetical protein
MDRNFRKESAEGAGASPPSDAWLFAQALLGKPVSSTSRAEADSRAKREQLEWLAQISSRHEDQLRRSSSAEAEARREREQLEWLAKISTVHDSKLRTLLREEAESRESQQRVERLAEALLEGTWDPSKHPKGAFPQNRGWWSPTGGSGAMQTLADGPGKAQGTSPFKTVALKTPDTAAVWKGAVIAARGRGLPTPILDWNGRHGTTIAQGATPKFQAGRFWGATLELDEFNILRLSRIGNVGKFNPATDSTALGNVYNEAFHAWFWGNKPSLGWLLKTMNSQKQFGELLLDKAEEAVSETINQVINDLESGRPILTYDELMKLNPSDDRRYNLTPGHNEPGQTTWGKHGAGSEKKMSEALYYAAIWVLYNGNKNPAPSGGNQLAATKKFFANKFHSEWTPQQVQQFVNSRYKN